MPLRWGQGRVRRHSQQPKAGKNRNLLVNSMGPGQGGGEPTPFPLSMSSAQRLSMAQVALKMSG